MKYDKINNFETPHTKFQIGQQVQITRNINALYEHYKRGETVTIVNNSVGTYQIQAPGRPAWWIEDTLVKAIGEST